MYKRVFVELLWLIAALVVAIAICWYSFYWNTRDQLLELQLHDTYFVFSAPMMIIPVFLLITFLLYFCKEVRKHFSRSLPAIIMLLASVSLIIVIVYVKNEIIRIGTKVHGGWTAYAPLGAIPQTEPGKKEITDTAATASNVLTGLQAFLALVLLYALFAWKKQRNKALLQ